MTVMCLGYVASISSLMRRMIKMIVIVVSVIVNFVIAKHNVTVMATTGTIIGRHHITIMISRYYYYFDCYYLLIP